MHESHIGLRILILDLALTEQDRPRTQDIRDRLKHDVDFRNKGFKPNTRGDCLQDSFSMLEYVHTKLPELVGLNVEIIEYPRIHEATDAGVAPLAIGSIPLWIKFGNNPRPRSESTKHNPLLLDYYHFDRPSAHCNCTDATMTGSAYLENVWLWVADHMTDDPNWTDDGNDMVQNSIYNARGFLIESTAATWLYGTASEHSVYYQSNINNAKYLFAGMIQTECRYYQPTPTPPAPFANDVGVFSSNPSFSYKAGEAGCDESWAVMIRNSEDVFIAGAGLYSWFST
ncbi:glucan 1,3-beta-glucosidase [Aspergillus udagawae]|nr:glucan 1,3-beta-glucosidase [Aspergillus udagawae]GFG09792.1 glucan 1,3-beta-glucosidase [Aspergillus udagawae]